MQSHWANFPGFDLNSFQAFSSHLMQKAVFFQRCKKYHWMLDDQVRFQSTFKPSTCLLNPKWSQSFQGEGRKRISEMSLLARVNQQWHSWVKAKIIYFSVHENFMQMRFNRKEGQLGELNCIENSREESVEQREIDSSMSKQTEQSPKNLSKTHCKLKAPCTVN